MHPLDFFRESDRALLKERIGEVFEKGESWVEAPFRSKDGRLTPYYFTGKRIVLNGTPCLVGMGIDVARRKRGGTAACGERAEAPRAG